MIHEPQWPLRQSGPFTFIELFRLATDYRCKAGP